VLKCDNLRVNLGGKEIVRGISFTLKTGQNLIILGENGVGKSTLAKAFCSLIDHRGDISLFGQDIKTLRPKERAKLINYVPPKLSVYDDDITLFEYVIGGYFAYKNKFEPYSTEEVDSVHAALRRFELQHLCDKRAQKLSSGEKQLASTLQAVIQNSRITVFDEPIANIDTARAGTLFGLLTDEATFQNKIVITHDLHFAFSLGFDILYLKDGVVDFIGPSAEFFEPQALKDRYGQAIGLSENGVFVNYEKI